MNFQGQEFILNKTNVAWLDIYFSLFKSKCAVSWEFCQEKESTNFVKCLLDLIRSISPELLSCLFYETLQSRRNFCAMKAISPFPSRFEQE